MDKVYRRGSICDYFEGGEFMDGRKFIYDKPLDEHHCVKCADAIQELTGRGYWNGPPDPRYRLTGLEKASVALHAGRNFKGYDPTTPLPYASVAPTSADLDAIEREMVEQWEDVLKELDLGEIE